MDLIGKQLPSVSAADNGKVLGVENGHWRAIMNTPATPADMVYIPYQSITYSSITDALAAGQTPFTKHTVLNEDYTFYLMKNEPSKKFVFCCVTMDQNNSQVFQVHFLQVTSSNLKVTDTEQFYNKGFVEELQGDLIDMHDTIALHTIPMGVSGTTVTLDLSDAGGINPTLQKYLNGTNIQFVGSNWSISPNNILIFTICGLDRSPENMHMDLSCVSNGKAYYVRLQPANTNVMRGTLYSYTLPATS